MSGILWVQVSHVTWSWGSGLNGKLRSSIPLPDRVSKARHHARLLGLHLNLAPRRWTLAGMLFGQEIQTTMVVEVLLQEWASIFLGLLIITELLLVVLLVIRNKQGLSAGPDTWRNVGIVKMSYILSCSNHEMEMFRICVRGVAWGQYCLIPWWNYISDAAECTFSEFEDDRKFGGVVDNTALVMLWFRDLKRLEE